MKVGLWCRLDLVDFPFQQYGGLGRCIVVGSTFAGAIAPVDLGATEVAALLRMDARGIPYETIVEAVKLLQAVSELL